MSDSFVKYDSNQAFILLVHCWISTLSKLQIEEFDKIICWVSFDCVEFVIKNII